MGERFIYIAESVEEAVKKGLKELKLEEKDVKIEVIEAGSSGFLGMFKKEAKVALTSLKLDNNEEEEKEVAKKEEIIEETITIIEEKEVVKEETKEEKTYEDLIVLNQDKILAYTKDIVRSMGYSDAEFEFFVIRNREYKINIKTEQNSSLLIGKRGATLNSLQFLINNYAKKFNKYYFRIELDCENYRKNRVKTLEDLAINMAKKSKRYGKPVKLEPMASFERKIIHNALSEIQNVETTSVGEEPHRYLVITAK